MMLPRSFCVISSGSFRNNSSRPSSVTWARIGSGTGPLGSSDMLLFLSPVDTGCVAGLQDADRIEVCVLWRDRHEAPSRKALCLLLSVEEFLLCDGRILLAAQLTHYLDDPGHCGATRSLSSGPRSGSWMSGAFARSASAVRSSRNFSCLSISARTTRLCAPKPGK